MTTTPIAVTIGTLTDTRRKHKRPKLTTVTRMAAFRRQKRLQLRGWCSIHVTVGTFEAWGVRGGGGYHWGRGGAGEPRTEKT